MLSRALWIFRNRRYAQGHIGYPLPGVFGFFGYMFWELKELRRNQKRESEIEEEFKRRARRIIKENEEIHRQLSEANH
ncbi:hypothetical protein EUTSA_v10021864mg [Eutrema salsugineum]|uniref:Uncharacterized protein n=1 Tax=Eutrema salsugineum TaxID=72664 RepID=V4LGA7_EUTSA|nr:hypothetical protein EUTSA_v10021864mg [Eutrema salsugineum]